MGEAWKPIPHWEGYYEVSNQGNVRSVDRTIQTRTGLQRRKGVMLKPANDGRTKHLRVNLMREGKPHTTLVHRAVLLAFTGNPKPGQEACHYDDDPTNNRLENLRWGSRSENTFDKVRNGNHPQASKTHCSHGHRFEGANLKFNGKKRACRSCDCAHAYISRHPTLKGSFQEIADNYFLRFMSAA